jgi:hypothetical protein
MSSCEEFRRLVAEMRALQREFHATPAKDRRPNLLRLAKEAEYAVDRALRGVPEPLPQRELFR